MPRWMGGCCSYRRFYFLSVSPHRDGKHDLTGYKDNHQCHHYYLHCVHGNMTLSQMAAGPIRVLLPVRGCDNTMSQSFFLPRCSKFVGAYVMIMKRVNKNLEHQDLANGGNDCVDQEIMCKSCYQTWTILLTRLVGIQTQSRGLLTVATPMTPSRLRAQPANAYPCTLTPIYNGSSGRYSAITANKKL